MAYVYMEDEPEQKISGDKVQVDRSEKFQAYLKIFSLFGFMLILGGVFVYFKIVTPGKIATTQVKKSFGTIEYSTPYKNVLYENFGFVNEPKLKLPMKTATGYSKKTFLLDSGAVISALPMDAAREGGVDLSKAKRIALQGFSGKPTFAYMDDVVVKIGEEDFAFPAVYTESQKTTYILGRKGFFEDFKIKFDNESKTVTLITKRR